MGCSQHYKSRLLVSIPPDSHHPPLLPPFKKQKTLAVRASFLLPIFPLLQAIAQTLSVPPLVVVVVRVSARRLNSSRLRSPSREQALSSLIARLKKGMGEGEAASFFDRIFSSLRSTSKYYTGFPKDLGPSQVINFTSERQFVQTLHEGHPVVVAFTIRGAYTKHLDSVLEEAAAEFYPHIKFIRVECPKYPGFCITRQRKDYPFIEIFHSPAQAANQGRIFDPNVTKYSMKVLPFNYDISTYGFREFFKRHGIRVSDSN